MKKYIVLLKRNRNLRLLSTVQLICYFGMWFSHIGIATLLINLNAEIWMISLSAAMAFIPSVFLAIPAGVIIDKFKAYPLLMIFMVIEALSIIPLLFIDSLSYFWILQALIFIRSGIAGMHFQVEMSLLPKILNKVELKLANEIHSIIWAASYTSGMATAGIYIHHFGIKSSFIADFVLYLIGIWLLHKLSLNEDVKAKGEKVLSMIKDGIVYLKNNPFLFQLILVHAFVAVTSYDALINIMAKNQYKHILSVALVIGSMNTIRACGLILGPIFLGKFANNRNLFWLFLGQAGGILLWAFLQFNFYIGFIGMFFAGLCTSVLWSYSYTLVQMNCDKKYYGRVIAYLDMIFLGMAAITSLAIGWLYNLGLSTKTITILMALTFVFAAFFYKRVYKKYIISKYY
ncbi:proton antiporter protein, major facilitator superfamily [Campylobacter blaseri]|uniref:MFS transporter n=1 Tax=Campylobacter blaseri TaxID=2042961 RepID=A0A2P8QZW9_9BACT|nr:MFS transporter [Campylobacter blaseri]PSM51794.1 MFS transporter [Campylobacter blaseri]PSM53585.1 MFS transporter [Campylobacter blaseri]QKF86397.1 proton antiporter protein, major facilitator superfamily [Campylobacter blaseri]